MKLLFNRVTNPCFNLALEEFVFENLVDDVLILSQNHDSVVLSRNDKRMEEVNLDYIKHRGIDIVRRRVGVGTTSTYCDCGSINYSIITNAKSTGKYHLNLFSEILTIMLARHGVKAEHSRKNELFIKGKQVLWNAQYMKHNRVMNHGTILYKSSIETKGKVEGFAPDYSQTSGVKKVNQKVTNISDYLPSNYSLDCFLQNLIRCLEREFDASKLQLSDSELRTITELSRHQYENCVCI
jgi:lipoate---protein ligase